MLNTYLFSGNKILVNAPGNSSKNRIKNALLWDINTYLSAKLDLYMFFVSKNSPAPLLCVPLPSPSKKVLAFQPLDDMYIVPQALPKTEIAHYRSIMDPKRKIDDDVFREMCHTETADIEYIAAESTQQLLSIDVPRSRRALRRQIAASFPVYVSIFGSKELEIVVNCDSLIGPIQAIVRKHCVHI